MDAPRPDFRRAAFTMIEILVVVAITLIAAGIALPSFVRSMQGQRLRTSARAIVTSHKFARNMAVLRQQPMAMLIDRLNGEIEVVQLESARSMNTRDMVLDARREGPSIETSASNKKSKSDEEGASPSITPVESRPLDPTVKVVDFRSDGDAAQRDNVFWVNYYPSGMSDGFTLLLRDERGHEVRIEADAISGGVEAEYD